MNIIPLLYFHSHKFYDSLHGKQIRLSELLQKLEPDSEIYLYDHDGIVHYKPNLCNYPKLPDFTLWADSGPRHLGDVVDMVLTGVSNIVLRKDQWPERDIAKIEEITECFLYDYLSADDPQQLRAAVSPLINGLVIQSQKDNPHARFTQDTIGKHFCETNNVTILESNKQHISHWKSLGVTTLCLDYTEWKELNSNEF